VQEEKVEEVDSAAMDLLASLFGPAGGRRRQLSELSDGERKAYRESLIKLNKAERESEERRITGDLHSYHRARRGRALSAAEEPSSSSASGAVSSTSSNANSNNNKRNTIFCDGVHDGLMLVNMAGFSDPKKIPLSMNVDLLIR
jgi:hypothetical protein